MGGVGKGPSVSRSHVFPPLPRLKGKVPWENFYAPHYPEYGVNMALVKVYKEFSNKVC